MKPKPVKMTVFLDRAIHADLKVAAARQGVSLTKLIAGLAERYHKTIRKETR